MFVILLLLFSAEPKPIYVLHNDNRYSKMLVGDLTRDWIEKTDNEYTRRMKEIQSQFKPRLNLIDVTKPENLVHSYMDKYPVIFWGKNGHPDELEEKAYLMVSFPLLSFEATINRIEFDYKEYKINCDNLEEELSREYQSWLLKNKPLEFSTFMQNWFTNEYEYGIPPLDMIEKKFKTTVGFPYRKIKYPLRPRIFNPWEPEFRLYPSNEKYLQQ